MRLNKFIAQAGVCSRRKADELIENGQIKVNGKIVKELGTVIDEVKDDIYIGKRKLELAQQKVYFALNKPVNYITSATSAQGKSVMELVKTIKERVFPVGRLDKDSRGLIILTDDGDFAYKLTQAKFECEKEYEVTLDRPLLDKDKRLFERGLELEGKKLHPVKVIGQNGNKINLILKEGVNRQIRRMAEKQGYEVLDLKRVRIAKLKLGNLKEGGYIHIQPSDVM
ncbi:MAG: pseudouridine synthase [Candidatus Buchananbacteria bacterium]|jgi:pseudouridine synthase